MTPSNLRAPRWRVLRVWHLNLAGLVITTGVSLGLLSIGAVAGGDPVRDRGTREPPIHPPRGAVVKPQLSLSRICFGDDNCGSCEYVKSAKADGLALYRVTLPDGTGRDLAQALIHQDRVPAEGRSPRSRSCGSGTGTARLRRSARATCTTGRRACTSSSATERSNSAATARWCSRDGYARDWASDGGLPLVARVPHRPAERLLAELAHRR